jgi:hypothetical protein
MSHLETCLDSCEGELWITKDGAGNYLAVSGSPGALSFYITPHFS